MITMLLWVSFYCTKQMIKVINRLRCSWLVISSGIELHNSQEQREFNRKICCRFYKLDETWRGVEKTAHYWIWYGRFAYILSINKRFSPISSLKNSAHIAGIAGKNTLNGRVDKITGLDPNRVGFNINQSVNRLAAGDARFVEVCL